MEVPARRSAPGTGLVLILRWYWWRINAWSEISAMIASFVVVAGGVMRDRSQVARFAGAAMPAPIRRCDHAHRRSRSRTVVWIAVDVRSRSPSRTRCSRRSTSACGRADPAGAGSRPARVSAASRSRAARWPGRTGSPGIVAVYATLFGIGKLIFGELGSGLGLLADRGARVRLDRAGRSVRRTPARGAAGRGSGGRRLTLEPAAPGRIVQYHLRRAVGDELEPPPSRGI